MKITLKSQFTGYPLDIPKKERLIIRLLFGKFKQLKQNKEKRGREQKQHTNTSRVVGWREKF